MHDRSRMYKRTTGRRWIKEEKEFFRLTYQVLPTEDIAVKLWTTDSAIIEIIGTLGVIPVGNRPWNEDEKKYQSRNYGHIPPEKIWAELDRTVKAIKSATFIVKLRRLRKESKQKVEKQNVDIIK